MALTYYLYNRAPRVHHAWTLAVLATSQKDADHYIRAYNPGMKRAGRVTHGKVTANCGAVTVEAERILREKDN